jgi:hypothetical protein
MEIIILAILTAILFGMAALNRRFMLIGLVAGIGLVMMGILIYTGDIQMQTGYIQNVRTDLNLTNVTSVYANVSDVLGGAVWIKTVVSIVYGAAGLLIFLGTIYSVKV